MRSRFWRTVAVASLGFALGCPQAPGGGEVRQAPQGETSPQGTVAPGPERVIEAGARPEPCAGDAGKAGLLRSCIAVESLTRSYVGRTGPGPTPSQRYCQCIVESLSDTEWRRLRERMTPDCALPAEAVRELEAREGIEAACGHLRL